ncbi:unnamed protein product, partial [Brassica rapa subsp. trilocularis]
LIELFLIQKQYLYLFLIQKQLSTVSKNNFKTYAMIRSICSFLMGKGEKYKKKSRYLRDDVCVSISIYNTRVRGLSC